MARLLAVFAKFERDVLRERVRAGFAHARQSGKRLGRPITAALHANQARKLRGSGLSNSSYHIKWCVVVRLGRHGRARPGRFPMVWSKKNSRYKARE